jgi:hypothetical protein
MAPVMVTSVNTSQSKIDHSEMHEITLHHYHL